MVVGVSFMAHGEASSFKDRAHRPGGDGESSPGGGRGIPHGPWGGSIVLEPGTPAWGGRGVQPRRWSGYPSWPMGRHHPSRTGHTCLGGDGESSPGGGRGILHGPWEGIILQGPGTPAWGGRGVQPRWWSGHPSWPMGRHHPSRTGHTSLGGTGSPAQAVVGVSFMAHGKASPFKNRAHRPGGDGESSPGGGRGILHGPWGGIILQEPGTPAWGGRGVQPRWWSGYLSGPMGRQLCSRTGHTGLGGTGSPAQVVVGVSFRAHGEAASS